MNADVDALPDMLGRLKLTALRDLAACRWAANGDALLIQGPPGVGKTHLAIALGREAIRHGYSVLFTGATALVTSLVRGHAEGSWSSGCRS